MSVLGARIVQLVAENPTRYLEFLENIRDEKKLKEYHLLCQLKGEADMLDIVWSGSSRCTELSTRSHTSMEKGPPARNSVKDKY